MGTENHPKAQTFSLKTPLLSAGQTNTPVAGTDLLKVRVKVYAEGGKTSFTRISTKTIPSLSCKVKPPSMMTRGTPTW